MIYYGMIIIVNIAFIIGLINLFNYRIDEGMIELYKTNSKILKFLLFLALFTTYVTILYFPIKKLTDHKALSKKAPDGPRGYRGNRGKSGSNAICNNCNDGLCSKKLLYYITKVINYWREHGTFNDINKKKKKITRFIYY